LAESFAGEQVPFSDFGTFHEGPTPDRIIVELKIPSYLEQSLHCVVDSGANSPIIYPEASNAWHLQLSSPLSELHTLNGNRCLMERSHLIIGSNVLPNTDVLACQNMTREVSDVDCLLPTSLFKQILISHAHSYIIINPRKNPPKSHGPNDTLLSAQ
jgi:hypothetical protein